ncbi:Transposon Ty3-I Gag-Pol polyprotein [Vitis vinifera]|uniref:Transposon Ty3-I Gag-Pol polyprotein n=1 Tax=Vitis vinifera TaxID=29760 RepID=A0A438GGW7_VITVI|nr:Transposon Ty3-I Gag-Pol polyprotein [Vitis vinifera]
MLADSTTGHSMLSFMDRFFRYSQILMAPEDMEKTSFIIKWGTYCYRVMPFGLKNVGATYQRAVTTLFHDMMHRDVEVYVDDMMVKSQDRSDHLAALERFFERTRQFRLRPNPKKCTFGVTSGELLGYMVSKRGIKVDPDKIIAILDMPAPRTEKKARGFLGRLQYISRFIARLTDIFLAPPIPGRPLLLYLSVSDMALGCMLAQLDDSGKDRAIYYLKLLMMISNEDVAAVTSLSGWRMYFDGAANHSGYGIGVLLISPHGDTFPDLDALELRIRQMKVFGDSNLVLRQIHAQNQFVDALATLASMIDIPADAAVRLIDRVKICSCLLLGIYPDAATAKDKRALRQLVTQFVICGETLYRRSPDGMLILCLNCASADRVMREVHAEVCGPHMGGHMLARKIMRTGYFWLTMETDCCQFVKRCP